MRVGIATAEDLGSTAPHQPPPRSGAPYPNDTQTCLCQKDARMKKEMLINVLQPEECRIAIVEDGILEELYVERTSHESYTGNIYKGKIVNLEPAIQAAFVDFSVGRNGFLARLRRGAAILSPAPASRPRSDRARPARTRRPAAAAAPTNANASPAATPAAPCRGADPANVPTAPNAAAAIAPSPAGSAKAWSMTTGCLCRPLLSVEPAAPHRAETDL